MAQPMPVLEHSPQPLADVYDVALLDLDGVVYIGAQAVSGAPSDLEGARSRGMRLAFVTNNAARTPQAVAKHLTEIGIPAEPDEVITSAQAAAHYLAERLPEGACVLVVGGEGLEVALRERGLRPVHGADGVAAVVQGYSPTLSWSQLAEGAVAIRSGVPWVATNLDPTVPSSRGPLPGNGSLVAALRAATGANPTVTGKPDPAMHRESLERSGARFPLVVGDRLDTDIEGAAAARCPSLLVLTGVTGPDELLHATPNQRPTYLGRNLGALLHPHPGVHGHGGGRATCGRWQASAADGALVLASGEGSHGGESGGAESDDLDALRATCVAAWHCLDQSGGGGCPELTVTGDDEGARAVLARFGL